MNSELGEDQLTQDLVNVNSLSPDQLENLVDLVLVFLLNPAGSDFQEGLSNFAETFRLVKIERPCSISQ